MSYVDAVFLHNDVQDLFFNRTVVVLGDSVQRSVYKDLVCLYSDPSSGYVLDHELRAKGEPTFRNDRLILGGEKINGTNYREEREYRSGNTIFRFYFITRCWNEYVESIFNKDLSTTVKPDVIIMNSSYWDVHHYGDEGKKVYEENMKKLFTAIRTLPSRPLLIWNAALPLAEICKGGFLRKGFKTLPAHEVDRANNIAQRQTHWFGFGFVYVDLYKSLCRHRIFSQAEDGIHWGNRAHRNITNSILVAVCHSWEKDIPIPTPLLSPACNYQDWLPNTPLPFYNLPRPPPPPYQQFMTPPGHHRYHQYKYPHFRNDHYMPRAHRRSYTDPFPLAGQHIDQRIRSDQYRARFNKLKNLKTPNGRHPLKESNITPMSTGPVQNSPPAVKPANVADNKLQKTEQDGCENTYKDCELCGPSSEVNTTLENSETSTNTCKSCEEPLHTVTTTNAAAFEESPVKEGEISTHVKCQGEVKVPTDIDTVDSSDKLLITNDINNNDNVSSIENERKRKRDNFDDVEIDAQKPTKTTKLAC